MSAKDKPVLILGAGGHAKVVLSTLQAMGKKTIGFLEDDSLIKDYPPGEVTLALGIGTTQFSEKRVDLFRKFKSLGYTFTNTVHPTAIVSPDVTLGEGAQIMAGATVQTGVTIGCNAIINTGVIIDHDCRIADHVHLSPGSVLSGNVTIGEASHIGTGASIIQGVCVGVRVTVGAGSVVLKDLPNDCTAYGNPAKAAK